MTCHVVSKPTVRGPKPKPRVTVTRRIHKVDRSLSGLRKLVLRRLRILSNRTVALRTSYRTLLRHYEAMQGEMNALRNENAALRNEQAALLARTAGQEDRLQALERTAADLQARNALLQEQSVSMQAQLSSVTAQAASTQSAVLLLQERLQRLLTPENPVEEFLQGRIGTTVTVETDAGGISGTVVALGTDYVQILEPSGNTVLVPLQSINTVG